MAKTIRFVREVRTVSDYGEIPERAYITLDVGQVKRILRLSEQVRKLGVYKIVEFDYTPTFRPDARIEYLCLNVTEDGFFWDGGIKHTSVMFETKEISIEELRGKNAAMIRSGSWS